MAGRPRDRPRRQRLPGSADARRPGGVPAPPRPRSPRSTRGTTSTACRYRARAASRWRETLNLIEAYEEEDRGRRLELDRADYLHWFSEATATAFADRNRYVGDMTGVPVGELTVDAFAASGPALFDPNQAQTRPIPFGARTARYTRAPPRRPAGPAATRARRRPTWHGRQVGQRRVLHADHRVDRRVGHHRARLWVPAQQRADRLQLHPADRPGVPDPNLPGPGKRPRSSMSPTIILQDGQPYLAVGSPGGATIITSVARPSSASSTATSPSSTPSPHRDCRRATGRPRAAEPPIFPDPTPLPRGDGPQASPTPRARCGNAIRSLGGGRFEAAAEPVRRGGGSAMVVKPSP